MLNRKETKLTHGAETPGTSNGRAGPAKARQSRRRFIISPNAPGRPHPAPGDSRNGLAKVHTASEAKAVSHASVSPVDHGG